METIRYSPAKLVFGGLFSMILAPLLGVLCLGGGAIIKLVGVILILGGPLIALQRLVQLLGNGEAVRYDQRSVTIHTGWRSRTLAWSEVRSIDELTLTRRMYGFIVVGRTHFLRFNLVSGKSLSVPINQLQGSRKEVLAQAARMDAVRQGPVNLVDTLHRRMGAQSAQPAAREPAVILPRPPVVAEIAPDPAPPGDGFDADADAALQRYLAQRDAAPPPAPAPSALPPRVAGFGRKGL